jgi:DNA polymerase III delta subunit
MLTITHGENQVASRTKLVELTNEAKSQNKEIVTLVADKLDRAKLETALLSDSLFGQEKVLVLENLHSLPKSKKKDEFINLVSTASINLILWEKKLLTKTDLKKLPADLRNFEFKVTAKLWNFLDQLSPNPKAKNSLLKLCHESVAGESAEFVFLMLARQLRLLIQIKEGAPLRLAPFMQSKLQRQAQAFSSDKLLELHHKLYQIDQKLKQSTSLLSLEAELDLFLLSM